jgi:hypothetical protein
MESEKRAIRDFHGAVKYETKGPAFSPPPTDRPEPGMVDSGPRDSKFSQHTKIEIQEFMQYDTANKTPMREMPWILPHGNIHISPPPSPIALDKSPPPIVGPNNQELQNIKNMILTLQLDLQEERSKRECLEEKMRKFEGNLTQKSRETPERKLRLYDMRMLNKEIPQNKFSFPTRNTINDVDEKIPEPKSDFDLRLRSLEQSLLEIRSILANNPVGCLKGDKKTLLEAGPSKDKDYNTFLYKKLERGIFPRQMSLKNAIMKSLDELLHKPWSEKTEIEVIMDQYYLDNLPPALLQPPDIEYEDRIRGTKGIIRSFSTRGTRGKIL